MCLRYPPALLLLDEHTSALDPRIAAETMKLTDAHIKEEGITTLMTTHNLNDAFAYGNRLLVMKGGRIIEDISGDAKAALTREDLLNYYYEEERC